MFVKKNIRPPFRSTRCPVSGTLEIEFQSYRSPSDWMEQQVELEGAGGRVEKVRANSP